MLSIRKVFVLFVIPLFVSACFRPTPLPIPSPTNTLSPLEEFVSMQMTNTAIALTSPTQAATLSATETPTLPPTITPTRPPCYQASWVNIENVPDNTRLAPGQTFRKTWRLKNTGSCTWTPAFKIKHRSGHLMGYLNMKSLTDVDVPPGGEVDINVNLTSPSNTGVYKTEFTIIAPDGSEFCLPKTSTNPNGTVWVKIIVPTPTPLPPPKMPDLVISKVEYTMNLNFLIDVRVELTNQGDGNASNFYVFWQMANYALPDNERCEWRISSLAAKQTKILFCENIFPNMDVNYDIAVKADFLNTISETNENNNEFIDVHNFGLGY